MCRIRWPAFLALLLVLLLVPTPALADETDVLGGFGRGLNDFYNPKTVDENEYVFAPLAAPTPRVITDDNAIKAVTDSFNVIHWDAYDLNWLNSIRFFLGSNHVAWQRLIILPAVGMVFFWWGVRKSKNVIIRVFKGKRFRL